MSEQRVVEMQWTMTDGLPVPPLQSWRTSTSRLRSSRAARASLWSSRPCKSPCPPRPTELVYGRRVAAELEEEKQTSFTKKQARLGCHAAQPLKEASHNQAMDLIPSLNYSTFLHPSQKMEVAVTRCLQNLSSGKDMWSDAAAPPSWPWLHTLPCLHSSLSSCGGGQAERKQEQRMRWKEGLNEELCTWPSKKMPVTRTSLAQR
jgi:hypothetical protein